MNHPVSDCIINAVGYLSIFLLVKGLVIKNTGSWYQVKCEDGTIVPCKIKGNFRLKGIRTTNPVAVGDWVEIELNQARTAFITQIAPRKNYIIRKASNLSKQAHILAANIDQALLIVTINYPETSTTFIDRFLATSEAYNIPALILFNKTDRYDEWETQYMEGLMTLYETIGYPCFKLSALNTDDVNRFKEQLNHKITLVSGHSGVGKSTFINALLPDLKLSTHEISDAHNTGLHTTTFSEMYRLDEKGYIIDTPGIKGFGTIEMKEEEISHYFKEIFRYSKNCRFNNCTHRHEPGCAVVEALSQHFISQSRYNSYLNILEDNENGKYRT